MSDLTTAARSKRDALASRTDVLDKVGALRCLPDHMHVLTDAVAEFYGVTREAIYSVVHRNHDELDDDGYKTVSRGDFEATFNLKVSSTASTVALFPRRAVLRIGMLLRESDVARRVRDYLLDAETVSGPQLAIPQSYAEALRAAADQWERAEAAEHALKQAEAWARELEPAAAVTVFLADADGDDFSFADAAKILCRHPLVNTGERRLFDQLNEWKWIYRASGRRHWCAYQSQVNAGRLVERIGQPYEHRTRGLVMPNPQVRITIKGIQDILHKLTGERDLAVGMVSA